MQKPIRALKSFWNAYKYTVRKTLKIQVFSTLYIIVGILTDGKGLLSFALMYIAVNLIAFKIIQRDCISKYIFKADKELYQDAIRASNNEIYGENREDNRC